MFKIKSFIETSFLDWDGKIASVIFLSGCNLNCAYCHNYKLVISPDELPDIPWDNIKNFLSSHKDWIDGVCITGGEPCIHNDLEELLINIKNENLLIKLDTNGCYPDKLKLLIENKLIDYVAMDIKAPLNYEDYFKIVNTKNFNMEKIIAGIDILHSSSIKYEFRTTIIPELIDNEDVIKIAKSLNYDDKYVLQNFNPINVYSSDLRKIKPYEKDKIEDLCKACKTYVKNCIIRL